MSKDDFFVGYSDEMPKSDRRAFLTGGVALVGTAAAGASLLALSQRPVGRGTWDQGTVHTFTGIASAEPYAMLRTSDITGAPQTALLACLGKCGVSARIASYAGKTVSVRGTLIQRDSHVMIAVVDDIDWITPVDSPQLPELAFPAAEPVVEASLAGTILDSKCWFGAMRPAEGKVHKTCAALCIRGGIPPVFLAKNREGRSRVMVMTEGGQPLSEDVLPFVTDPVLVKGAISQRGDLLFFDMTDVQRQLT